MPNHTTTNLTIKGSEDKIAKLRKNLFQKNEQGEPTQTIDFASILPPPANMFHGNLGEKERNHCKENGIENWYDWQSKTWGTKWNAYEGHLYKETPTALYLDFQSAWDIPRGVLAKLEDMGFEIEGIALFEGGEEPEYIGESGGGDWCLNQDVELCV